MKNEANIEKSMKTHEVPGTKPKETEIDEQPTQGSK